MKAAVVHAFDQPLRIEEGPIPTPSHGQVVVKMETCGLVPYRYPCRPRRLAGQAQPPFIPGHEGVGIVERLGAGVTVLTEGDRVAIPWLGYACGACEYCASGRETLCPNQQDSGYTRQRRVCRVRGGRGCVRRTGSRRPRPLDAAPLTCAGVTTYKAVKVSGRRSF